MSEGFTDTKLKVSINADEVDKLIKKYKKIKKYMKSSLFTIKTMDGSETIVNKLLEET